MEVDARRDGQHVIVTVSDSRLAAFAMDTSVYAFDVPDDPARVDVVLLFRRAFRELMDQKGWDVPDILMEQAAFLHCNSGDCATGGDPPIGQPIAPNEQQYLLGDRLVEKVLSSVLNSQL